MKRAQVQQRARLHVPKAVWCGRIVPKITKSCIGSRAKFWIKKNLNSAPWFSMRVTSRTHSTLRMLIAVFVFCPASVSELLPGKEKKRKKKKAHTVMWLTAESDAWQKPALVFCSFFFLIRGGNRSWCHRVTNRMLWFLTQWERSGDPGGQRAKP